MKPLAVISDDLTGANENGIHFFRKGYRFKALIYDKKSVLADVSRAAKGNGFLAVDTETRQAHPVKVKAAVGASVKVLKKSGAKSFYLKMDSTLRGNIGVSIRAAFSAVKPSYVAVCFAFPDAGRTTKNGVQYVNGVPVKETAFASDPLNPVTSSRITDVIGKGTGLKAGLIGLGHIRSGVVAARRELERLLLAGVKLVVFDCVSNSDIGIIAAALYDCRLFAGASALANGLCTGKEIAGRTPRVRARRVVGLIGSMNPATREQLERLVLLDRVKCIYATPKDTMSAGIKANFGLKDFIVVLDDGPDSKAEVKALVRRYGPEFTAEKISCGLAEIAKKCGADPKKDAMFFSGGATAAGACRYFGLQELSMVGVAAFGIPVMRSDEQGTFLITKSGGFGDRDALVKIYSILKGKRYW